MSFCNLTITNLIVKLDKHQLPRDIHATFSNGCRLHLDYQKKWQQCFVFVTGYVYNVFTHKPFRHHIPEEIQTKDMTRKDWADVCFKYFVELRGTE